MLTREEIGAIASECGLERVASEIAEATLPAARLEYAPDGASRIGGLPRLPDDVDWPAWRGRPMSPLAQVSLDDLPSELSDLGLPFNGTLAFFWDSGAVQSWTVAGGEQVEDAAGWGFDPADAGSASVIFVDQIDAPERSAPSGLAPEMLLTERRVAPVAELTIPSYGSRAYDELGLTDDEVDVYLDGLYPRVAVAQGVAATEGELAWAPRHQLVGHADVIQGDMQLEAQLVTNGLYCGDSTGYHDPRAAELEAGADQWRLLLQLGSDEDELGVMWGDVGRLYFWIRDADLRAGRFDAVWLILQCS